MRGAATGIGGAELLAGASGAGSSKEKEEGEEDAVLELLKLEEQLNATNTWLETLQLGRLGQSTRANGGAAEQAVEQVEEEGDEEEEEDEEEEYAVTDASLSLTMQKLEERVKALMMRQRGPCSGVQIDQGEPDQPDQANGGAAEKARAEESPKPLQQLCRADMVHYLDVMNGWDEDLCGCCFDRAVSPRAQRALAMKNLEDLRFHLRNLQPRCIPAADPTQQQHHEMFSQEQFAWKAEMAPRLCAEGMFLEWMAEPRVAIATELGASRQRESDNFASMLVQVLGVKESADLQEGFGFFVQQLLSGGLEEAHAERRGGAGGKTAEKVDKEGKRKGGAEGKASEKTHGEGKASYGKDDGRHGEEEAGSKVARKRLLQHGLKQTRGMNGVAAADVGRTPPAAAVAAASADMDAVLVPVNRGPVVAALTYRVGCILQWVRVYGSDSISEKRCFKDCPQSNVRPMRHPLRDLPSLLVRFGAIPKPLEGSGVPLEWEEWPGGGEAAVKFPVNRKERCVGLGIVEERGEAGEKLTQDPRQHIPEAGGRCRRARGKGCKAVRQGAGVEAEQSRARGRGEASRNDEQRVILPPARRKLPIVRCLADVDFLVGFAGYIMHPRACTQCCTCSAEFIQSVCMAALIANFARVLSAFPPSSPGFDKLVECLDLPARLPRPVNLQMLLSRAEQVPLYFLIHMAVWCARHLLESYELEQQCSGNEQVVQSGARKKGVEKRGKGGRVRGQGLWDGEVDQENGGEVWEEVRMWYCAAMAVWSFNKGSEGESEECRGSRKREGLAKGCDITWILEAAITPRYCEGLQGQRGSARGSSNCEWMGSSSSNSNSSEKKRKGKVPAYLKAWPGGVILVACLREMLLGEPCYRPASHAAMSAPATASTHSAAAMASCPTAPPNPTAISISAATAAAASDVQGCRIAAESAKRRTGPPTSSHAPAGAAGRGVGWMRARVAAASSSSGTTIGKVSGQGGEARWGGKVGRQGGEARWGGKVGKQGGEARWGSKVGKQGGEARWGSKVGRQGGEARWGSKVGKQGGEARFSFAFVL
ncbi:unnamed protein product [Closterium sp. Naga37s-1]|nr:unnamed protein product [Closterium sp. Naga37s-1]CAI5514120.1 unnamed protein product [Closterium sp. Naga37s-1]